MKRTMKTGALLALALIAATACTRRVQVESEPSQNYNRTSAVGAEVDHGEGGASLRETLTFRATSDS